MENNTDTNSEKQGGLADFFNLRQFKKLDRWGVFYGIMVGVIFGIIPLITVFNSPAIFRDAAFDLDASLSVRVIATVTRAAAVSFFNDSGTIVLTFILLLVLGAIGTKRKTDKAVTQLKGLQGAAYNISKAKKLLFSKAGIVTMIAGLFGGPIGNTLFFALFIFITPSIGSVFFVLEPIFTGILAFIVFRRKHNRKTLVGLTVVLVSVATIVLVQSLTGGIQSANVGVAIALGVLGILAYSTETFLVDVAVSLNKQKDLEGLHYLQLKGISSGLFGLLLLPILGSILVSLLPSAQAANFGTNIGFLAIGDLLGTSGAVNNQGLFVIPLIVALLHTFLLFLGRIVFYRGIQRIGATLTNTLFQIQVIITPIAAGIVFGISSGAVGGNRISLYSQPVAVQITFWVLAFIVVLSSMYVTLNKELIDRKADRAFMFRNNKAIIQHINSNRHR